MRCLNQKDAVEAIFETIYKTSGLFPVIGLPRSGKSTLIKLLYDSISTPKILIKSGEFDCSDIMSGVEKFPSLRARIINAANIMAAAETRTIFLVDSMKDILYDGKSSMRIGGISNDAITRLNELNIISKQLNIPIVGAISTSTLNINYNQEIASIIAGSSSNIAICRYDYSIALDLEAQRSSIFEITSHLVASPEIIDATNL